MREERVSLLGNDKICKNAMYKIEYKNSLGTCTVYIVGQNTTI